MSRRQLVQEVPLSSLEVRANVVLDPVQTIVAMRALIFLQINFLGENLLQYLSLNTEPTRWPEILFNRFLEVRESLSAGYDKARGGRLWVLCRFHATRDFGP